MPGATNIKREMGEGRGKGKVRLLVKVEANAEIGGGPAGKQRIRSESILNVMKKRLTRTAAAAAAAAASACGADSRPTAEDFSLRYLSIDNTLVNRVQQYGRPFSDTRFATKHELDET